MEIQLRELIDKIKKEGVQAAETEAEAMLSEAKAQAEKIVADAQNKADKILADAKTENERMVKSSEDAIKQAGRNVLISFRESIDRELNAVLNKNVMAVYSTESLSQLIIKVVECWADKPDTDNLEVVLNDKDLKSIEEIVLSGIKDKVKKGVTLKASNTFDGGFRISVNDGNAYYDYSAEAVVEMLSKYLSPKVSELLKEAE